MDDPTKWYRHVNKLQRVLNSTYQRSIGMTPFELMFGVKMRNKDFILKDLIDEELMIQFENNRDELRNKAKLQIQKTQDENCKTYNKKHKTMTMYKRGDLVAIKRVRGGPERKLRAKYLGPYRITRVKANNIYDVEKVGIDEGPQVTSTCAEYVKPWITMTHSSETDE